MATDLGKLRGMTAEELNKEELAMREAIWKLRVQRITGQLQDPKKVRRARRDLARLLTVRRELELRAADKSSKA